MEKQRIFTVPNVLSMLRIVLVAVFMISYLGGNKSLSFAVVVASCLSDMLDGWIARTFNQITELGKVLDPIADKLFTVSTLLCLCIGGVLPWWFAAVLLGKELFMLIGGAVFMRLTKQIIASRWYGKVTTVFVFTTLIFSLITDAAGVIGNAPFTLVVLILCLVSTALALFSLVNYTAAAIGVYRQSKALKGEE